MPDRRRNGSWGAAHHTWRHRRHPCRAAVGFAASVVFAACLNGNAEPIVHVGGPTVDGSAGDEGGAGGGRCNATAPLVLYYRNGQPAASTDQIDFLFKVANATGAAIPLSSLAIRYYFTNEVGAAGQSVVYYQSTCCGPSSRMLADATVTLHPTAGTTPAPPTADAYLEVTFDAAAGSLLDGDAVQAEVGFHAPAFAQMLNQTNDYSYIAAAASTQAEWDLCPSQCATFHSCLMTVYRDGVLVWGLPP